MTLPAGLPSELTRDRLRRAWESSASTAIRTPILRSRSMSEQVGAELRLKAENLQRTGSFKLRGALNKLRVLEAPRGVVAGSAGNHAQSLAYAARIFGVPCEIFMPAQASVAKHAAVEAFGATVHRGGESVDECVESARARARDAELSFVHPFDDLDIVTGQAGVGIEILEDEPTVGTVIVPVGGGGLIAGVAAAIKQHRPQVRIIGVQAERCAPFPKSIASGELEVASSSATIADGIAIKRPGGVTLPLVRNLVDDLVSVSESAIAEAMVLLLERSKIVVEGAGAAALAAFMSGEVKTARSGATVAVMSGGNVDTGLLAAIWAREETRRGRRLRVFTRITDTPGGLAALLATIAELECNLLSVDHVRDGTQLDVRETAVELTLETRGDAHTERLKQALEAAGYETRFGPVP